MKYRIVKLGSKDHGKDAAGFYQIFRQEGEAWRFVTGSTVSSISDAEALLASIAANELTDDEIVKEVEV